MAAHLRLRRIIQTIADLSGKRWTELRILDLGSLEGLFAIECARQGAHVVAIEGRETNNAIARATVKSLALPNIKFVTEDVCKFSQKRYGTFDVVICSG